MRGGFDPEHFAQIIAYLKFYGLPTGMLFDFGKQSLLFQRIVFSPVESIFPAVEIPPFVGRHELAATLLRLLNEIHAVHGLGGL